MRIFILSFLFFLSLFGETFYVNNTSEFREALKQAEQNFEDDTIILQDGTYDTEDDGLGAFTFKNKDYNITIESEKPITINGPLTIEAKDITLLNIETPTIDLVNSSDALTIDTTNSSEIAIISGTSVKEGMGTLSINSLTDPVIDWSKDKNFTFNKNSSSIYLNEVNNAERVESLEATLGDGITDEGDNVIEKKIVDDNNITLSELKKIPYIEIESVLKTKAVNILNLDTKQLTYKKDKWYMVNAYHLLFIDKEVIDYIWEYDSENGSWKLQDHINKDQNSYKKIDEFKHEKAYWIKMNEDFTFEYNHPLML